MTEPVVSTRAGRALLGLDMTPEEGYWVNLGANEMRAAIVAIEAEVRAEIAAKVAALTAYHPHEAPYVGGDAALPCIPTQCAGGMRLAVLEAISSSSATETQDGERP